MNIKNNNEFIFQVADLLRGSYSATKYKEVIFLFFVIKWLEEKINEKAAEKPSFDNKSKKNLQIIAEDPTSSNLLNHLNLYSPEVLTILKLLDYENVIKKLEENDCLSTVINQFANFQLCNEGALGHHMGYVFEEIIRKFSRTPEAGDHYTPKEVVELLTKIMTHNCKNNTKSSLNILDMACGTGGMLVTAMNYLEKNLNIKKINLYGQEINAESCGICKSNILIHGHDPEKIVLSNTMKGDKFPEINMDYVICNPPFGQPWGGKNSSNGMFKSIKDEYEAGENGRFGAGLPSTSDMQLLFFQHAIKKLNKHGKAALICNNSILHSGGSTSGESQIRRYLLEKDLIECIIALPSDLFYNTSIQIFAVILNKSKPSDRKDKLAIINAEHQYVKLEKSFGFKKKEITTNQCEQIFEYYKDWTNNHEDLKVCACTDFLFQEYSYKYEQETTELDPSTNYEKEHTRIEQIKETEQIPITKGVEYKQTAMKHFEEYVKPFHPNAKIILSKDPITGSKILISKYFYKSQEELNSQKLQQELQELRKEAEQLMNNIFNRKFSDYQPSPNKDPKNNKT